MAFPVEVEETGQSNATLPTRELSGNGDSTDTAGVSPC